MAQFSTNGLPSLIPARGEMPPTFWGQHGTEILLAGFAVLILVAFLVWMLLQPKPQVVQPPEVVARRALKTLSGQSGDGKLLSEASQIVRRYMIAAFDLPADEMTTAEFIAALAHSKRVDLDLGEEVSRFLRECDVRKFSTADPAAPFNTVPRAQDLINLAEKRRPFTRSQ